ncbi:MAG: DUF1570 domain-containing protein [Paludisphaera borealis]|uniref:DUF1570 domain-containing protein n=1 Tax=Paludisphaera borealis TaxID=1387353 RepID=UPI00284EDF17|nr:DUF1570 domain-containing protein [Paludisphaera borealis]MDR3617766.1 DUF1570 domain-containing protein [Paludisphaera borealis]
MIHSDDPGGLTRRELLGWASASAGLAILSGGAQRPGAGGKPESTGEADQTARVEARAKEAGLAAFRSSRTEHFLCLGNAPDSYREAALEICEALAKVYTPHLRDRGFKVAMPPNRMMVVALKDPKSYEAFLGEQPGQAVGGHYDLDANRLVIFDFRPNVGVSKAEAERQNTFALVHETAHLLCFNTGLLATVHEPPKCVTEGLATYFEMWRPKTRAGVGAINRPRLLAIRQASQGDVSWIETSRLLVEDELFTDEKTQQLAYGQCWLLLHYLLQSPTWQPKLVEYLKTLANAPPQAGADRVKTAEEHLGSLARMDERIRKEARSLLRG